jgi:hypothetical protein
VPTMDTIEATGSGAEGTGFVFVRQGGQGDVNYTVTVRYFDGAVDTSATFTHTTPASTNLQTDDDIAEGLRALIDAHADLAATRVGSVIEIEATDVGSYLVSIEVTDSRGDQSMVAISFDTDGFRTVRRFTDLPLQMIPGVTVKVSLEPEDSDDNYYVRFDAVDDSATTMVGGEWVESLRPRSDDDRPDTITNILYRIRQDTMPLRVTRRQDDSTGTVTGEPFAIYFEANVIPFTGPGLDSFWHDRLVGDEDSNPNPDFIGNPIRDLFLYRGRLGFLSTDTVTLSEADEPFNFWRSTIITLPDTDPIEVSSGAREALDLEHAVASVETCLIFSSRQQFELQGDPTLTPSTAQLTLVRSFDGLGVASPVNTGRGAQFTRQVGQFSGLLETTRLGDASNLRVEDLTVQAPRFIRGAAAMLAHSSLVDLTVLRAEDLATLYVHQSFYDDTENRLQSGVARWTFGGDIQIRGLGFFDSDLYLVTQLLEEDGRVVVHLDRQFLATDVTYAGPNDETTIALPYDAPDDVTLQVVDGASGLLIPVVSASATELVLHGDYSDTDLYVGESFPMRVELSEPVIRDQGPRGLVPRMGRPIDLHRLHLYLAETAYLEVEVTRDLRGSTTEEFSAAGLGTGLLLEGSLNRYTGDASFAIISTSIEAAVAIVNDTPFPSYIQAARWEALVNPRAQPAA